MIVLFDTSVWIEEFRRDALRVLIPRIQLRYQIRFDAVVAGELQAGCRSKRDRRALARILSPYERAGRVVVPGFQDFLRAGDALSRLRQKGKTLKGVALLDAVQAADAARLGALLVTQNVSDFEMLRTSIPVAVEAFDRFRARL